VLRCRHFTLGVLLFNKDYKTERCSGGPIEIVYTNGLGRSLKESLSLTDQPKGERLRKGQTDGQKCTRSGTVQE
jgi:hypothetical protein